VCLRISKANSFRFGFSFCGSSEKIKKMSKVKQVGDLINSLCDAIGITEKTRTEIIRSDIKFFGADDKAYGQWSNYDLSRITINGETYESNEHWYQSEKFRGICEDYRKIVAKAKTPHQSKLLGNLKVSDGTHAWRDKIDAIILKYVSQGVKVRSDWESVKQSVMKKGLIAKFRQHKSIRQLLLDSGNRNIIENSPTDSYWGCGYNGEGKNVLGKLLMEIRTGFRKDGMNYENPIAPLSSPSSSSSSPAAITIKPQPTPTITPVPIPPLLPVDCPQNIWSKSKSYSMIDPSRFESTRHQVFNNKKKRKHEVEKEEREAKQPEKKKAKKEKEDGSERKKEVEKMNKKRK